MDTVAESNVAMRIRMPTLRAPSWSLSIPGPEERRVNEYEGGFGDFSILPRRMKRKGRDVGEEPPRCPTPRMLFRPVSDPLQPPHPIQVVSLPGPRGEGPEAALRALWRVPNLALLAVGGDGTAAWVAGACARLAAEMTAGGGGDESGAAPGSPAPPLAILPLGTGNDLSRTLGWGGGGPGWEGAGLGGGSPGSAGGPPSGSLPARLLLAASPSGSTAGGLDRWCVEVRSRQSSGVDDGGPMPAPMPASPRLRPPLPPPPPPTLHFLNYLGCGLDGRLAAAFHALREAHPLVFSTTLGNKACYALLGAVDLWERDWRGERQGWRRGKGGSGEAGVGGGRGGEAWSLTGRGPRALRDRVQLWAWRGGGEPTYDVGGSGPGAGGRGWVEIMVPADAEGVVLLNIPSYMGGADLWGLARSHHGDRGGGGGAPVAQLEGAGAYGAGGDGGDGKVDRGGEGAAPDLPGGSAALKAAARRRRKLGRRAAAAASTAAAAARRPSKVPAAATSAAAAVSAPADRPPGWPPQRCDDGLLEAVAVRGPPHLGLIRLGLAAPFPLAQARAFRLEVASGARLPCQADGEPSALAGPATVVVRRAGTIGVLRRRVQGEEEGGGEEEQ